MKKTILLFAAMALVTLGFFTSCDPAGTDDLPPVITITEPTADTIQVEIGDSVTFKVSLSSDNTLKEFKTLSNGVGITFVNGSKTFTGTSDEVVEVTAKVTSEATIGTPIEITFTLNDEKGTSNVKKVIVAKKTVVSLSAAQAFEWKRVGAPAGEGLAMFGLKWESNTGTNVVISNGATKFVKLSNNAWTTITTADQLKGAIDGATNITKWEEVSSQASKSYDFSLGTLFEGTYFLIHVTNGKVETAAAGTTITITGEYKK
jgi:hypothetical protein